MHRRHRKQHEHRGHDEHHGRPQHHGQQGVPFDENSPERYGERGRTRAAVSLRGQREKARWYLPVALGIDAVVPVASVVAVFHAAHHPHPALSAAVACASWVGVQAARGRYATHALGESRGALPVLHDWFIMIAVLAVLSTAAAQTPEPLVCLAALAPSLVSTLVCRRVTHRHLTAARREARAVHRVLVVGEAGTVDGTLSRLGSRTDHAYAVVGTVVVGDATSARAVVETACRHDADLVLVAPATLLGGDRLRGLCWELHDSGLEVALTPGLVETSVKRLTASSVAGLTVLRVAPPLSGGAQTALKSAADRCGAALGLLLLSPLFLLVAAAIRTGSRGPALYRQQRVGQDRRPFTMWKFRTMVTDADQRRNELAEHNENDGPMFKMRRDPRVTRVGRLLRRTSLDELPQLLNVVAGDMSLVGPRPPLPDEVAAYDATALRRLRVKPGMTGLWQVSGRSDLSWDETVQLDLHYVDNWSFSSDLDVMSRTLRAVVDGRGAY